MGNKNEGRKRNQKKVDMRTEECSGKLREEGGNRGKGIEGRGIDLGRRREREERR